MMTFLFRQPPPSVPSRVTGALAAFVFGALTIATLPWLRARKFPVAVGLAICLPLVIYFRPFCYFWIAYFACAACYLGFKAGVYGTMDIFNLLRKTGDSHDPKVITLAESLRRSVIISAVGALLVYALS
jgi:hypothetical protein